MNLDEIIMSLLTGYFKRDDFTNLSLTLDLRMSGGKLEVKNARLVYGEYKIPLEG